MGAFIKAISYYLPDRILTNEELVKDFPEWTIEKIAQKVGVESRHIAGENQTAGDMAEQAALKLFEENGVAPSSIDFILFCTESPDYFLPATACILQDRLGIPTSAGALDYNLGCSGCIYGLALAKGIILSGIASNVLLLTSETYNKYIHHDDKSNRSIFGDGAAACLISEKGFAEIGDFVLGTDGSGYRNLIVETGASRKKAESRVEGIDSNGNIYREDYLYMDGSAIFNFTLEAVPTLVSQVLEKNRIDKSSIDYFVFHQANKFMLNTIRKVCGIQKEKFYTDLTYVGNTVSSTVLIGLKDCIEKEFISAGDNVMIAGFGVGLSWGGTLLKF